MPECLPVSCPEIKKIDNGNASNFTGFYMDKIEFTCYDGSVNFLNCSCNFFLFFRLKMVQKLYILQKPLILTTIQLII